MIWSTIQGKDEREDYDSDNDNNLNGGQPELKFPKELDAEPINGNN